MERREREDLTGQTFGRWTVLSFAEDKLVPSTGYGRTRFLCYCACGTRRVVEGTSLRRGSSKSCGCERPKQKRGKDSSSWKGGRRIDDGGYVQIYDPDHHRAKTNGYVREHIVIMEQKLERPLIPGENVHHKNGNKADNKPDNLELWNTSQPAGQRVEDKLKWAKEIIKLYG